MRSPYRLLICVGTLGLLLPQPLTAEQWTRFRGPNGSGVSQATTIPTRWTSKDYHWRVKLPGIGYSSPVVWGQKIFVQ